MAAASSFALGLGALGAFGAISEGQDARRQANFIARVNEQQAYRERQISAEEERDFRKNASATLAERRAALGAAGVQLSTGSPLLASEDFAAETELQALRIRRGGETRASRLEQEAAMSRRAGRSARRRSFFRAGSSLLSGGAGLFG